jgi:pentatricopeptide repeat protein
MKKKVKKPDGRNNEIFDKWWWTAVICRRIGQPHLAFCVLAQSLKERCGATTIMFTSIIKGLCEAKQVANATKVMAKMPLMECSCPPNLITYNTPILFGAMRCLPFLCHSTVNTPGRVYELHWCWSIPIDRIL